MKKNRTEIIKEIDELIKKGDLKVARNCLRKVQFRRLDYPDRVKLAEFTRKLGEPIKTIRLLNPIIRASSRARLKPSSQDKTLYAAALIKIGASTEALEILRKLDPKDSPQSLLFQSHALFTFWNYGEAISLLKQYLRLEKDEYQKIVGEVNLSAALVQENQAVEAEKLLAELLLKTKRSGLSNFEGNSLEILAQQEIQKRNWKGAQQCLEQAHALLQRAGGLDEFFVRKWQVILEALREPKDRARIQKLIDFREESQKKRHWETVRECDRFLAEATQDKNLFYKVYFGTPYHAYREKLLANFPKNIQLPETFLWAFKSTNEKTQVLRLLKGEPYKHHKGLKVGQLKHRLLRILVSDFYRPIRVASIFALLHPNEFFHPVTSATRVYQAIKELRSWFQETAVPLDIKEFQGGYRLVGKKAFVAIEIPNPNWWNENPQHRIAELRKLFGEMNFTASQVSQRLGLPRRTAFYVLRQAIDAGLISRVGGGAQTRYKFVFHT